MTVTATNNNMYYNNNSNSQTNSTGQNLDQNAFLQILVSELENQDPMNPQDSSTFVTQMAQLSSLEQMTSLNTTFNQALKMQQISTASAMIGHTVSLTDSNNNQVQGQVTKVTVTDSGVQVVVNGTGYDVSTVQSVE